MAFLTLRLADELPSEEDPLSFIAERICVQDEPPDVWLWADNRRVGRELLGDDAKSLTVSTHLITLTNGGSVRQLIPRTRPDGEAHVAVWMATTQIPAEYMRRLLGLGQCEEFWARAGTVPNWANGSDWRMR